MKKIFYIGSLKISFTTDFELSLQEFDKCFLQQVLPTTKQIDVQINQTDFQIEAAKCIYHGKGLKVYKEENKEIRVYNKKNERGIVSVYDGGSNVHIYMPDMGEEYMKKLRPWFQIHLEELLLYNQAMILHSASLEYNGNAILFSGPSGTGKTTQTDLWHRYKDNVTDINGDRTVLQLLEGKWYACGFPIYGSTVRCKQKAVPLRAIVYLKQGKNNEIRELAKREKIVFLYKELNVLSFDNDFVNRTFELLDGLVEGVTIIQLTCRIDQDAVEVLHEYLYKGV